MASFKRNLVLQTKNKLHLKPNKASVLICIYQNTDGKACFALMERADDNSVHSGQICLPGGKTEKLDYSNWSTAVRETEEEIGINKNDLSFVKELSSIYIPPSNFNVFPFIGLTAETPDFKPQISEVESVIEVSLKAVMNAKHQIITTVKTSYGLSVSVPAFNFNGHIVWGATAMILMEIIYLFNLILKK